MKRVMTSIFQIVLMLAFSVAMAATSSANHLRQSTISPELIAYLEMGGHLADICNWTDDQLASHDCPLCRLEDVTNLADQPDALCVRLHNLHEPSRLKSDQLKQRQFAHIHFARGPPDRILS